MLWTKAPFSARRRAVGLDRSAVDGGAGVDAAVAGQGLEDVVLDALAAPAIEAVVDRRVRSVFGGAVAPARTRLEHMDNTGDHPVIVDTPRATPTARQVRLDPGLRLIVQPIELPLSSTPSGNLESENRPPSQDLLRTDPRRPNPTGKRGRD